MKSILETIFLNVYRLPISRILMRSFPLGCRSEDLLNRVLWKASRQSSIASTLANFPLTLALVCSCMFFVNERYLTPEGERKWLMGVIDRPIPGLKKTVGEHGSSRPLLVGMG